MGELDSTHPDFNVMLPLYNQMRDTYAGQHAIKAKGTIYLKPTSSMVLDGALRGIEPGKTNYENYLQRAIFPDLVGMAARTLTGLAFKDPSVYELPKGLEELLSSATKDGNSLETLHRRIVEQILLNGRTGLLVDVPEGEGLPYFVPYHARSITNWDSSLGIRGRVTPHNFVITAEDVEQLAEGGGAYEWTSDTLYRVFELKDSLYQTWSEIGDYTSDLIVPEYNGRSLDFVPFTFIGAQDLASSPGPIPLLGISNSALSIYCGEADLRMTLHMVGQDTLVLIGVGDGTEADDQQPVRVGASAVIKVGPEGDAKYIGVSGEGLTEQRLILEDDYKLAVSEGSRLLENTAAQAESGEALKVRVAAKTTTLTAVALTAAAGLTQGLRQLAIWVGANPDEVRVVPNLDFHEDSFSPQAALNLAQAKNEGLPLSAKTVHAKLRDQDYTEMTWEEEVTQLRQEQEDGTTELLKPKPETSPAMSQDT